MHPIQDKLYHKLIQYYNENICNHVNGQLRNNIQLRRVVDRPSTGLITTNYSYLKLPPIGTFFHVYMFDVKDISWLVKNQSYESLSPFKWISLEELCNIHHINIDVYTQNGLMIPKRLIYLNSVGLSGNYIGYIAIDTKIDKYIPNLYVRNSDTGQYDELVKLFLTVYVDTTIDNNRTVTSYIPGDNTNKISYMINKFNSYISHNNEDKVVLYINGYAYKRLPKNIISSSCNYIVELIEDFNVDKYFTQNTRYKYLSNIDSEYKDLIHVPIDIADDNIYTVNLFHIYVYDKKSHKGIKVPFTIAAKTYQVTHTDIGIPEEAINGICEILKSEDIEIDVRIHKYNKLNKFVLSETWFELLYKYAKSDSDIISILTRKEKLLINKLDASTLEQSSWVKLISSKFNPDNIKESFPILIQGLGYYHILTILGNIKFHIETTNLTKLYSLSLDKNLLIQDNKANSFLASIYKNGIKLPYNQLQCYSKDNKSNIEFRYSEPISSSDSINVKLDIDPQAQIIKHTPTSLENEIEISNCLIENNDQFDLYIKEDITGYQIYDQNNSLREHGFRKLSDAIKDSYIVTQYNDNTDITKFLFTNNSFNKELYITPKVYSLTESFNVPIYEEDRHPSIYLDLLTSTINEKESIPFLGVEKFDIYVNGRYLIENLDFKITKLFSENYVAGYIATIHDKDYLNLNGNNLIEVVAKTCKIKDKVNGLGINNVLASKDKINNLWLYNSTDVFINGKYIPNNNISYKYKDRFTTNFDIPNISVYEIITSIPDALNDIIDSYIDSQYWETTSSVLDYLVRKNLDPTPDWNQVIVTQYKTVYSSYLNDIVLDIIKKNMPDYIHNYSESELQNILSQYDWKKKFDLFLSMMDTDNPESIDFCGNRRFLIAGNESDNNPLSEKLKFSNLYPDCIEIHPTIDFDPRNLTEKEISTTKIILLRSIVDYVLSCYEDLTIPRNK